MMIEVVCYRCGNVTLKEKNIEEDCIKCGG
jgi:hypothetical protein